MSHRLETELRAYSDRRGAGRNTRGRVCSPILTAYLRLSAVGVALLFGVGNFTQAAEPSLTAHDELHFRSALKINPNDSIARESLDEVLQAKAKFRSNPPRKP